MNIGGFELNSISDLAPLLLSAGSTYGCVLLWRRISRPSLVLWALRIRSSYHLGLENREGVDLRGLEVRIRGKLETEGAVFTGPPRSLSGRIKEAEKAVLEPSRFEASQFVIRPSLIPALGALVWRLETNGKEKFARFELSILRHKVELQVVGADEPEFKTVEGGLLRLDVLGLTILCLVGAYLAWSWKDLLLFWSSQDWQGLLVEGGFLAGLVMLSCLAYFFCRWKQPPLTSPWFGGSSGMDESDEDLSIPEDKYTNGSSVRQQ